MNDLEAWLTTGPEPLDIEFEDGDIVTDVIVLVRVQRLTDTDDALVIGVTPNTGGITQYGVVCAAKLQLEQWMTNANGGDE